MTPAELVLDSLNNRPEQWHWDGDSFLRGPKKIVNISLTFGYVLVRQERITLESVTIPMTMREKRKIRKAAKALHKELQTPEEQYAIEKLFKVLS